MVILITHKLAEARAVADRITVLRGGRVVAETTPAESDEADLARLMIGELAASRSRSQLPPVAKADTLLEIDNLSLRNDGITILDGISLRLTAGEIVGIAGVDGNGQAELTEVLAGARGSSSRNDQGSRRRPQRRDCSNSARSRPRRAHPRHAAVGKSTARAADSRRGHPQAMA